MATAARKTERRLTIPDPYLQAPFDGRQSVACLAGWRYDEAEIAQHGLTGHGAIDFQLDYGEPVLAAAGGYAVATWDERWLTQEDGTLRLLDGRPMTFGQGLTVQIYHGGGRYTQYGHLGHLPKHQDGRPMIPLYVSPAVENGDIIPHEILRAPVKTYLRKRTAAFVTAGTTIGYVGLTGGALGARSFDAWQEHHEGGTLAQDAYPTYMKPHLHLVEFRRHRQSRAALRRDPFGLYGQAALYPTDIADWSKRLPGQQHRPLWL